MNITDKEKSLLKVIKTTDDSLFLYNVVGNSIKPKGFVGVVNSLVKKGLITKVGSTYTEIKTSLTVEGKTVSNGL